MEYQLKLTVAQHQLLWKRRNTIERRFEVKIHSPFAASIDGNLQERLRLWDMDFSGKSNMMIMLEGHGPKLDVAKKYINEVFIQPEIIEIFSYHEDLSFIFGNVLWIEVLEELYGVFISIELEFELHISGTESSVMAAVSGMKELLTKYDSKGTLQLPEVSLLQELKCAVQICTDMEITCDNYSKLPHDVINLLLGWLKSAYRCCFSEVEIPLDECVSDSPPLDDSVLILDYEGDKNVSVIVLDSEEEGDHSNHNKNSHVQNNNQRKRKIKFSKKRMKKRRRKGLKFGPKKTTSVKVKLVDRTPQPILDNSGFIPLSLNQAKSSCNSRDSSSYLTPPASSPQSTQQPRSLRPVVIDGSNVAFYKGHSRDKREDFSWKRIETCLKYFTDRGHSKVRIIIPQHRQHLCYEKSGNKSYIESLEDKDVVVFTPARWIDGQMITCYDDRFIVDLACRIGGVILSNDRYRDIMQEKKEWAETIKSRLLMYVFVGDELMIPEDPLGPRGPHLDDFLAFPPC